MIKYMEKKLFIIQQYYLKLILIAGCLLLHHCACFYK